MNSKPSDISETDTELELKRVKPILVKSGNCTGAILSAFEGEFSPSTCEDLISGFHIGINEDLDPFWDEVYQQSPYFTQSGYGVDWTYLKNGERSPYDEELGYILCQIGNENLGQHRWGVLKQLAPHITFNALSTGSAFFRINKDHYLVTLSEILL